MVEIWSAVYKCVHNWGPKLLWENLSLPGGIHCSYTGIFIESLQLISKFLASLKLGNTTLNLDPNAIVLNMLDIVSHWRSNEKLQELFVWKVKT